MVRLFVGGLPPDIDARELAKRFSPFGVVTACEYAKPKPEGVKEYSTIPRGFAYLNIEPIDDAAIRKCLTAYNHSKWKGHVLRVEVARPDFLSRLQQEWAEEEAEEEASTATNEALTQELDKDYEQEEVSNKPLYFPIPGRKRKFIKAPLDGSLPDGTKRQKKTYFPPGQSLPYDRLTWAVPQNMSSNSAIVKINQLLNEPSRPYILKATAKDSSSKRHITSSCLPSSLDSHVAIPPVYTTSPATEHKAQDRHIRPRETHEYLKVLKAIDSQSQKQALAHGPLSEAAERLKQRAVTKLKVVEFLEDEDEGNAAIGAFDMGRFDSDSEDDVDGAGNARVDGAGNARVAAAAANGGSQKDVVRLQPMASPSHDLEEGCEEDEGLDLMSSDIFLSVPFEGRLSEDEERLRHHEEEEENEQREDTSESEKSGLVSEGITRADEGLDLEVTSLGGKRASQPAASEMLVVVPGVSSKRQQQQRQHKLDMSRFGSDSEEEFHDVEDSEEEKEGLKMKNRKQPEKKKLSLPAQTKLAGTLKEGIKQVVKMDQPQHVHDSVTKTDVTGSSSRANKIKNDDGRATKAETSSLAGREEAHGHDAKKVTEAGALSLVPMTGSLNMNAHAEDTVVNHEQLRGGRSAVASKAQAARQQVNSTKHHPRIMMPNLSAPIPFQFSFFGGLCSAPPSSQGSPVVQARAEESESSDLVIQTFGQSFVRPKDKSAEEVRASWDAQRQFLVTDYKSKQRTALRHAGRAAGGVMNRPIGKPRR
ncbi:hypothetical protein CEUSTIGMA_g13007.t1 [Chlamydomonas eustigma]|uniref:RRM domain-containing protein n=1 Tax=Chlamydomonas eustigma TaxID=1157962 RepID=A0A250XRN6_9CHLO|nr:hypothetical protein CEUSTIGMA_g13007.t1 [Chlamydomonas eustigma]|eukprot:GAX85592.1 hypothetical protein CEUSTIGMA_g13007.t1 [Chlamydomonas eustigma]